MILSDSLKVLRFLKCNTLDKSFDYATKQLGLSYGDFMYLVNRHIIDKVSESGFAVIDNPVSTVCTVDCKVDSDNEDILNKSIDFLDLSVRSWNILHRKGINTVGELLQYSESDILRFRNCGKRSITEIVSVLSAYGLSLKK